MNPFKQTSMGFSPDAPSRRRNKEKKMKTSFGLLSALLCCCTVMANDAVVELSEHLPKIPALVVVVCEGEEADVQTIARLVEQRPWTLFCKGTMSSGLDKLRDWAMEKALLGERMFVVADNSPSLWLADDMADAVWVAPAVARPPSEKEMMRVLRPGGVCIASGKVVTKPAQPGVDEWRHPYHDPDNNVVSRDRLSRLPGELRFQTYPVFAAMPNQTLFAGGRIFFFSGHIAFHEREEPLLNTLTVLNAYNGLSLWSRPLHPDYVVHNVAKLATDSEVVYTEGGTLRILDAETGRQRATFKVPSDAASAGDTDWKWIAQEGGTLWAAFGPPDATVAPHKQKRQMGHWPWNVANDRYRSITNKFGAARRLAKFQYPDMKLLWSVSEPEPFDARALCMEGGRIFEMAPRKYVAAREAATGEQLWRCTPETSGKLFDAIGNSLKRQGWGIGWATYCCARAGNNVVCIAGPSFTKTIGISLENGDLLWASPVVSPHPFFFNDALYIVPRVGNPKTFCRKVDPLTGKTLDEFQLGVIGSCTRLTVTPNQFFYRPGGGEGRTVYVDMPSLKLSDYEGVVRPGCFDGVVPANGRLYWMPLACDCWQVHGTFCMAPRSPLKAREPSTASRAWAAPASTAPPARDDWPMLRADAAGTATVPASLAPKARESWRRRLSGGDLTAPICVKGRIFVGATDGTVQALDADNGGVLWRFTSHAAVLQSPAYWNGRILFGSCDGALYGLDASNGRLLGRTELAPEKRFVNIMNRLMSAWPLGGGVVLSDDGIAYTAAGSTAADGAVVAAVNAATGTVRWKQTYTLDRKEPKLSFGVQGNILLKDNTLYINGGAPVGIIALDAHDGGNARLVSKLEAGMETFLEPGGKPLSDKLTCTGPELFSHERTRTTIFKRHQGRVYFKMGSRHVALIDGRLFCSRDRKGLDRIVDLMNKGPKTSQSIRDVLHVPLDDSILWTGSTKDVCGLAVGADGLVALHPDSIEGVSIDGQSLWSVRLPAPPVRWGVALTGKVCVVTLSDGHVICLANPLQK